MSRRSKDKQHRKLMLAAMGSQTKRKLKLAATVAMALLLVAATVIVYWSAIHGSFVWDDESWTTNIQFLLRNFTGLKTIWFHPTALQQYYPLAASSFWIDYHLWGFWPLPYHVENVLLHASAAILFWRLLTRLQVPGAWLAGAIFALHPVMVESAGWITERKNVLSLVFYLGALLAYGRFTGFWRNDKADSPLSPSNGERVSGRRSATPLPFPSSEMSRCWGEWGLAFLLLLGALLSKTTAFSFPAVILLICWWKRGCIRWKEDVLPVLPFFALAIAMSCVTAFLEKNHVGAKGPDWALSFPQRCIIAGRVFWFYLGKLAWPASLCFVYPRWTVDSSSVTQWLYPIAAISTLTGLWLARKWIGRGPATTAFFFIGTLFPVLGFMNAYFMRFSFVCDHWTYLSSLGPIALFCAVITRAAARWRALAVPYLFAAVVLPVFAVLTWCQGRMYADIETLWRTTIERNPGCFLAQNNLGYALAARGKLDEAIPYYKRALQLDPNYYADAHNNLGNALAAEGKWEEARQHYERALQLNPDYADAHNNFGVALEKQGKWDEAVQQFEQALKINPDFADAHNNLGYTLAAQGKLDEGILHFKEALRVNPDFADAHINFGITLAAQGKWDEAIAHYQRASQVKPDSAEAQGNLGNAFAALGENDEARQHFQQAINLAEAQNNNALAEALRARLNQLENQNGKK